MGKLTTKHKLFAKNLVKTNGQQTQAYQLTYPNASKLSAQNNSSRVLKAHPEIKQYVVQVLNSKGLAIDDLVGKLKKLTNAKKEHILPSGEIIKTADNTTRMTATTQGFKLHGLLSTSVNISGDDNRQVLINVDSRPTQEVNTLTIKLNELHNALALDKGMQQGEVIDVDVSVGDDTSEVD